MTGPGTVAVAPPTLRLEKQLLRSGHVLVCGCDEVGRGALAGPVTVGMVLVDVSVRRALPGVHDSKLLPPAARQALVPRIQRWAVGHAVGHASAAEVDRWGLVGALCLAGHRALRQLPAAPDVVLLDGNHDWLLRPLNGEVTAGGGVTAYGEVPAVGEVPVAWGLLQALGEVPGTVPPGPGAVPPGPGVVPPGLGVVPPGLGVVTAVKADQRCASVAAASVLAKTTRDAIMVEMASAHPGYGWEENKGYGSPAHRRALARLGPCPQHRRTWRLPGEGAVAEP